MDDFAFLSPRETEHYLFAIEASLQVRGSHQLFLWAQGQLQSLLPHGTLICVHGNLARFEFTAVRYTRAPLSDAQFAEICDQRAGLVSLVIGEWYRNWQGPWLSRGKESPLARDPALDELIERYQFDNLACHGTQAVNGGANSCFILARMPRPPGRRQRYLLELLVPHLHAAYVRTLAARQRDLPPAPDAPQRVLTSREVEILRWVSDGKSNFQIGRSLSISPLTVKNHVQNILKKLDAQNRTQAVSRAINLRLIDPERRY
jgi:transcriptional regulator EpsA